MEKTIGFVLFLISMTKNFQTFWGVGAGRRNKRFIATYEDME